MVLNLVTGSAGYLESAHFIFSAVTFR